MTAMLRGVLIFVLLFLNLCLIGIPLILLSLSKLFLPGPKRAPVIRFLARIGEQWVTNNNWIFDTLLTTKWEIDGIEGTSYDEGHYLIISNHISWVDIFALFRAFHHKTGLIRFFLKRELIWMPIAGQACWALEFPFMNRYTPEYLAKHPEKRGADLATTRKLCRRYRRVPMAILNFVEGTRFSREKQADQESPYKHLLRPRIGGISFVLASIGEQLDAVFDVTLAYPNHDVTMWDFVTNRIPTIVVHARRFDVTPEFIDLAVTEPGPSRDHLKDWLNELWAEKDAYLDSTLSR